MNAQEHGKKLIAEARNIYHRDVKNAVDYPKVHDVGPTFVQQVRKKKPAVLSDESLRRVEAISLQLSQIRTLSFYFEHGYSKEEAETASAEAEFVLAEIQKLLDE
ncbi:MAG: HEPN domain-containing protein [Chloroflexi bacterium]|nr:HEPN domain-containing protein [Chloroflexota bacterium]MBI5828782.1 HEPN domain-containing protein [Chloroflexota bacterium]